MVEDEPELGAQAPDVEGLGPAQRALLAGGEEQLESYRRTLPGEPPDGAEDGGDRGLVVGPEDGLVAVAENAVLPHHLDRGVERHRVEVGAEQDGRRARRAREAGQ
jgi:hypothetical protein